MEIYLDHGSILGGVSELKTIGQRAVATADQAAQNSLNASFSGVSGLDQLGGNHGGVINGGAGSAITVLQSYAEQVSWLSGALAASYEALTGQNAFVARGMDIADEGGNIGQDGVSFPTRPRPRFESFTFTPPVVLPATSLGQLSSAFSATKIQDSVMAARMWHKMSADVTDIAGQLQAVASDLGSRNRGDVIEAAIGKVSEVARAGETFALNSQVMGSTVERLSFIKQQGAVTVNLAMAAIAAIPDPVARQAAEASFLASFPASYTPTVATGIPPIRNLMVMDPAPDGGGEVALGGGTVAGTGEKHNATGLRAPGAPLESLTSLQRAIGAGQFGTVQAGMQSLAGVGGGDLPQLVQTGDVGTTAASTGALTAPSTLGAQGTAPTAAGGAGAPFGGTAPLGATAPLPGTPRPGGNTPLGGGLRSGVIGGGPRTPGATGSFGVPGTPGSPLNLQQAGTTAAGTGARGPVPMGGPGPVGLVPGAGRTGRIGTLSGTPTSAATPAGHAAVAPTHQGVADTPRPATPTPAAGGGGVGTGAASRSTGGAATRGMMPMMGAPLAGQQQSKPAKVRTVTSAVEEEDNVSALLGERPAVVPGVIGAWARG